MTKHYPNRNVVNVKSPKNEAECRAAYAELNPAAKRRDGKVHRGDISYLDKTEEKLTTEVVGAHYVICSSASPKYLSGFYFNNSSNEYYVYQKMELTNTDAFSSNPSIKIGLDSSLYGYYQEILNQ